MTISNIFCKREKYNVKPNEVLALRNQDGDILAISKSELPDIELRLWYNGLEFVAPPNAMDESNIYITLASIKTMIKDE